MIKKMENAVIRAFLKAKLELMKLQNEEDGMETLEVIILVAVAVVIAGAIIGLIGSKDGDGLIHELFEKMKTWFNDTFGNATTSV